MPIRLLRAAESGGDVVEVFNEAHGDLLRISRMAPRYFAATLSSHFHTATMAAVSSLQ